MASKGPGPWSPGINVGRNFSGPMQAVGGLFAMSADAVKLGDRAKQRWGR
jgi:phospholipid/cholesterol/gamma-HCH transport system permease protein